MTRNNKGQWLRFDVDEIVLSKEQWRLAGSISKKTYIIYEIFRDSFENSYTSCGIDEGLYEETD